MEDESAGPHAQQTRDGLAFGIVGKNGLGGAKLLRRRRGLRHHQTRGRGRRQHYLDLIAADRYVSHDDASQAQGGVVYSANPV
jgi:hypothetical protein